MHYHVSVGDERMVYQQMRFEDPFPAIEMFCDMYYGMVHGGGTGRFQLEKSMIVSLDDPSEFKFSLGPIVGKFLPCIGCNGGDLN